MKVYQDLCKIVDEWIEIYKKDGRPLPLPTNKKYSGKFVLRAGSELHQALAIRALNQGESLNSYVVKALKKTSMYDRFELILGRGETPKPKPYKEALEHTANLMGLNIEDILFIGDHQIDCDSAINSGCSFIGVATGRRGLKSWEGEQPPDVLLKSVADLPEYLNSL